MNTQPNPLDDDAHKNLPKGMLEGMGSTSAPAFDTPDCIRDCIAERYIANLDRAELQKAAVRLADDLKRRYFSQTDAERMVLSTITGRLGALKRDQMSTIAKSVKWVYEEQEHGISCTGALARDGLCFITKRTCRFHQQSLNVRQDRIAAAKALSPDLVTLLSILRQQLQGTHPTESLLAEWTYLELATIEQEFGLIPGDAGHPIYATLRTLGDRISARHQTQGYDRYTARRILYLLEEIGWVKLVEQGKAGTYKGKSNGYMRVLPPPAPAAATDDNPLTTDEVDTQQCPAPVTADEPEEDLAATLEVPAQRPPSMDAATLTEDLAFLLEASPTPDHQSSDREGKQNSSAGEPQAHGGERQDSLTIPHVYLSGAESVTNTVGQE